MRDNALQQRVTRLRELIKDAHQEQASPAAETPHMPANDSIETDAWRRFNAFAQNDPLPSYDMSEEAIAIRDINRIAVGYGWVREIQRFLDTRRVSSLSALASTEVFELQAWMLQLENCAVHGCDPPDVPAAR